MRKPYVVVGAGVGGLAIALRLAHRGERVIVLERTDKVGGRNRRVTVGACGFDGGPTLMMMLDPFRRLFTDVGERLEYHLSISLCDPSYRVFYSDGSRIEATTDLPRMTERIRALAGDKDAAAYPRMLRDLKALYEAAVPNFVRKNFRTPFDFFGPRQLGLVARHGMLRNLAAGIAGYVKSDRLRMLFSFQTMYLGLSPYRAPWVYAVLTHMEYGEGIWYPQGGMAEVSDVIARLATQRGAEIRLGTEVDRIEGSTVVLAGGETIDCEAVICNADLPYAERKLLGVRQDARRKRRRFSCSALTLAIDYEGSLPELLHHNVFFGADFAANLEEIFERKVLPEDPAFYVAVSARSEPSKAPPGHENLFILIPCPNLEHPWTAADEERLKRLAFARLEREVGFDPSSVAAVATVTPEGWQDTLNLERGAAFGLSHDFWQSAYFRPGNRSRHNPNVYFVGASTAPGNGLPMVLISAELAEERIMRERAER